LPEIMSSDFELVCHISYKHNGQWLMVCRINYKHNRQ